MSGNGMFRKAQKSQGKARIALIGPSGSGKTYTALQVAQALGKRIAVIDTERGSASKYAGTLAEFDTCTPDTFAPDEYVKAIRAAEDAGYDVLVIDSLSHAWAGKGGALEMVDAAAARQQRSNSFAAWREVTPAHNRLVDAIVGAAMHVIVTMRVKTEYVIEDDERGKKVPRKVGLAPVQRDGVEYEFDVVADMNQQHDLIVSKTRCPALDGVVIHKPDGGVGRTIAEWLSDGTGTAAPKAIEPEPDEAEVAALVDPVAFEKALNDALLERGFDTVASTRFHSGLIKQRKLECLPDYPVEERALLIQRVRAGEFDAIKHVRPASERKRGAA